MAMSNEFAERDSATPWPDRHAATALSRLEDDLASVVEALALAGIKRCEWCRRFFRSTEPGELFEYRSTVCYGCVAAWWPVRAHELAAVDREKMEAKLAGWLRRYHRARTVKNPTAISEKPPGTFRIVMSCLECRSSGGALADRCRYCDGMGSVGLIFPG